MEIDNIFQLVGSILIGIGMICIGIHLPRMAIKERILVIPFIISGILCGIFGILMIAHGFSYV